VRRPRPILSTALLVPMLALEAEGHLPPRHSTSIRARQTPEYLQRPIIPLHASVGFYANSVIRATTWLSDSVLLLDGPGKRVLVMDSAGLVVRSLALHDGSQFPSIIGRHAAGIWVGDPGTGTLHVFDGSGRPMETPIQFHVQADGSPYYEGVYPDWLLADGTVASVPRLNGELLAAGLGTDPPLLRFNKTGERLLTYSRCDYRNTAFKVRVSPEREVVLRQPFTDADICLASPNGEAVYHIQRRVGTHLQPAEFSVTMFAADGQRRWRFIYRLQPVVISVAVVDSVVRGIVARLRAERDQPAVAARVRSRLYLPEALPPVEEVLPAIDTSGLWLNVRTDMPHERQVWLRVDATGRVDRAVSLPRSVSVLAFVGSWAIVRDVTGGLSRVWYRSADVPVRRR